MITGAIPVAGIQPMPDPLDSAVRRCLEMDPDNRYQSAAELAQELRAASTAKSGEPLVQSIRAVIVDDEDLARMLVREFLSTHGDVEVIAECSNGFEAVKTITETKPDLVFLDVQMPKLDGFEVLELASAEPAVVFTTAYDQYAMKAFDAHAVDYLLKPFSAERFDVALDRARERLRAHAAPITPTVAAELAASARAPQQYAERIVVKDGAKVTIIPVDKLDYVDAQDDYVALHSMKRSYLKQQTISSLEAALDPKQFVRIHRSCIVNIERIAKIEPYTKDSRVAILHDTTRLPVSRAGYTRLSALLEGKV